MYRLIILFSTKSSNGVRHSSLITFKLPSSNKSRKVKREVWHYQNADSNAIKKAITDFSRERVF